MGLKPVVFYDVVERRRELRLRRDGVTIMSMPMSRTNADVLRLMDELVHAANVGRAQLAIEHADRVLGRIGGA